jgi:hypothetical protein
MGSDGETILSRFWSQLLDVLRRLRHGVSSGWYDAALARNVAPDGVAPADASFEPFLLHAPLFRGDEIEKRIAGNVDVAMRREQLFDLLARPAAAKWEPVASITPGYCPLVHRYQNDALPMGRSWLGGVVLLSQIRVMEHDYVSTKSAVSGARVCVRAQRSIDRSGNRHFSLRCVREKCRRFMDPSTRGYLQRT